jgi:hypothetical protein
MFRIVCVILALSFFSCESAQQKSLKQGEQLAKKHCSTCHQFPEPSLLDKKTWVFHVLPKMGGLLGFRHFETTSYIENDYVKRAMELDQWNKIVRYYVSQAPDTPIAATRDYAIDTTQIPFRAAPVPFRVNPPLTSFVGIVPGTRAVWFADGISQSLYLARELRVADSLRLLTGISHIAHTGEGQMVVAMGVMYPSDAIEGKIFRLNGNSSEVVLDSLQRPVFAEFADLNSDSLIDIIVCEFGNNMGKLSWFEKRRDSGYRKHILKPLPGAVKTVTRDFNNDGRPDILALMAQADEGFLLFINEGKNKFREKRLLRFSPAYGSNYFELADIDKDGDDDIIATNGDNGDYPPVLKSYHGIRVYMNDGKNNFKDSLFFHVNGANKVIVRDFDKDGDNDMVSIAYFPDYLSRPYETFIYWQNNGGLQFTAHSFPSAVSGRWLVMDAGDIDADGDEDIVLGSAKMAMGAIPDTLLARWNKESPSLLLLENLHTK